MRSRALCWSVAGVMIGLALLRSPTHAAEITVFPARRDAVPIITVVGELLPGDGQAFARAAARVPGRAVVGFASPGGSLIDGLQIGQVARLRRFATFVSERDYCASACAVAWLAGVPRIMQPASRIGFHAAFTETAGAKVESGVGNAFVGAYLNNLQISFEAIAYLEKAHPNEVTWLTIADANRLGIAVRVLPSHRATGALHPGEPDAEPDDGPDTRPGTMTSTGPAARPDTPARPRPEPPRVEAQPPARPERERPLSVMMPELSAPLPPDAAPDTPIEEQACGFVRAYFAHWSETGGEALRYFGESYSSRVAFYGRTVDRDTLLASKLRYTQRWPVRVYAARADTMRVFCQADRTCTLAGVVDWDCRNPARQTASKGSANFFLTVAISDGHGEILAENGSVLSRDAE